MVNREVIENGAEERNGKDAAHDRRLEKLRRDFGSTFLAALNDPLTIEILLNADGTLWQEKLGGQMEIIGEMSAARAEAVLRTIAACLNTVITWDQPTLEGELPLDGSRFAGQFPRRHSQCASAPPASSPWINTWSRGL